MSIKRGNSASPLTQYETIVIGTYKEKTEQLLQSGCLKFIDLINYHKQLSNIILSAANQALEATVENSTEREDIKAHLQKCLGTQCSVLIAKNSITLAREVEDSKAATEVAIDYFEKNFQKRLDRLQTTTVDDGSVDEYIETLVSKSMNKTMKHLSKRNATINEKELNFRIQDMVTDKRDEIFDTVSKTVVLHRVNSLALKTRDDIVTDKLAQEFEQHNGKNLEEEKTETLSNKIPSQQPQVRPRQQHVPEQPQQRNQQTPQTQQFQPVQQQQQFQPVQQQQQFQPVQHVQKLDQFQPSHQQQQPFQPSHQQQQPFQPSQQQQFVPPEKQRQQFVPPEKQRQQFVVPEKQRQQFLPSQQQQQQQQQQLQPALLPQQFKPTQQQQQLQSSKQQQQFQAAQQQFQQQKQIQHVRKPQQFQPSQQQHQFQPVQPQVQQQEQFQPAQKQQQFQEQQLRERQQINPKPYVGDTKAQNGINGQQTEVTDPQESTKYNFQEDKVEKNKPNHRFFKGVQNKVKMIGSLMADISKRDASPNTVEVVVLVPLVEVLKTGVQALPPEEDMQTMKLSSSQIGLMNSGEKQATLGFFITNSRVYVTERRAEPVSGIVRSFHLKQTFQHRKILNGSATQVQVDINILDLLTNKQHVSIDTSNVAAADVVGEFFDQIANMMAKDNKNSYENSILISSAYLSSLQIQKLKSSMEKSVFQNNQFISLHSLLASSLGHRMGKGIAPEIYLIIHFTTMDFQVAVARVSNLKADILGYADYQDLPNVSVNSVLFLSYHKDLCLKATTYSDLPSKIITNVAEFYKTILEKALSASKIQAGQIVTPVHVIFDWNLKPLKSFLNSRVAPLKSKTITTVLEQEVLQTTGLPVGPCSDVFKHDLWLVSNNVKIRKLLEKSKPLPKKESTTEVQLQPQQQQQNVFELQSSRGEKESYRVGDESKNLSKLLFTTFPDGTYQIHF